MKKTILLSLAIAMMSTSAMAGVPADINMTPGVLHVTWNAQAATNGKANQDLIILDDSGDTITVAHANLLGHQVIRLPLKTQGELTLQLGQETSKYKVPYQLGSGKN